MTEKIISIRCKGNRTMHWQKLKEFQGDLKEMPDEEFNKLKNQILKHGWIAPVFVWNGDYILDGHGRLKVLQSLVKDGYKIGEIPVVDIEAKDKTEAKQILLAINSRYQRITEQGLRNFLADIEISNDDLSDLSLPEISLDEIKDDLFSNKQWLESGAEDEVPVVEDDKEPVTNFGDLIELDNHRILCGDATKKEDVAKLMNGKKADVIFTDPPYGVSYSDKNEFLNQYDKGNRNQKPIKNDNLSVNKLKEFLLKVFTNLRNILDDYSSYYITAPQGGDLLITIMMAMMESGLTLRHMLIWNKNNHVLGRVDYMYKHEPILYGWAIKHKFYGKGKYTKSVWDIPKPLKSDLHPTMKPVELVENALLNSSIPKSIIVDVFLGSGSTLIACEKTNCICYGMEIEPHYCDVIIERWCNYTNKSEIKINGEKVNWFEYKAGK